MERKEAENYVARIRNTIEVEIELFGGEKKYPTGRLGSYVFTALLLYSEKTINASEAIGVLESIADKSTQIARHGEDNPVLIGAMNAATQIAINQRDKLDVDFLTSKPKRLPAVRYQGDKQPGEVVDDVNMMLQAGMTEEELDPLRSLSTAPGVTVGELIELGLEFEEIEWREIDGKRVLIKKSG